MDFETDKRSKEICNLLRDLHKGGELIPDTKGGLNKENILKSMRALKDSGYISACLRGGPDSIPLKEELASLSPALFLSTAMTTDVFGALLGHMKDDDGIMSSLEDGNTIGSSFLLTHDVMIESLDNQVLLSGRAEHVINSHICESFAVPVKTKDSNFIFLIPSFTSEIKKDQPLSVPGFGEGLIGDIVIEGFQTDEQGLRKCEVEIDPVLHARLLMDELYSISALGLIKSSMMSAIKWAKTRKKKGTYIIDRQEYAFPIGELFTLYEGAKAICLRSAWAGKEDIRDYPVLIKCAKVFCCENAEKVSSMALQIMGKEGLNEQNPVLRNYLCSRYLQVAGSSNEEARMGIADIMLKQ